MNYNNSANDIVILLKRAWLLERFAVSLNDSLIREEASCLWQHIFSCFSKKLHLLASAGIVQRRAVQIASRYGEGFTEKVFYSKTLRQRKAGNKFYKSTHKTAPVDTVAIACAEGAIATMMLKFHIAAARNSGCSLKMLGRDIKSLNNQKLFYSFVTRAAIDYNEDIRRQSQQDLVKIKRAKSIKRTAELSAAEVAIRNEIRKEYKDIVDQVMKGCDRKCLVAYAARLANARRGRSKSKLTKSVLGLASRSGWWTTIGVAQTTATDRSNTVKRALDMRFQKVEYPDILAQVLISAC